MADNFDNYGMKVQATASVKMPAASEIDKQIRNLEKSISKLQISGKLDDSSLKNLSHQLDTLKATVTTANFSPTALTELTNQVNRALQNINIGNINVGNVGSQAQQVGQQIGNAISQGVANSTNGASQVTDKILRDFSELNDAKRKFVDESELISKEDIADANKFYQTVREAFKEFGQVTISKGEMTNGELESLRVKIQQVNGELKTTREFMLYLNQSSASPDKVKLADDDTIKTTERMVQHLNEAKNITNATGDEANALKQKLAEQEKYYDKLEQASKEQLAIEKQRITAGEKQLEVLDKQSKRRDSRISYNESQIDKKGLTDISRVRDINDMVSAGNEKYDSAFAKEIDKNISSLSKLKDKWQEQGVYVDEFKTKVETLENALNNIDSGDVKGLNSIKQQMEALSKEASQIAEVNKIQLLSNGGIKNDYATQIAKLEGDFRSLGLAQDTIATKTQNVKNSLATLRAEFAKPVDQQNFQAIQTANDNLQRELIESRNEFEQLRASMKGMATEQQRLSLANTIEAWNQKNTAATKAVREENERYVLSLRDLSNQMTKIDFNKINTGFKQNENSMRTLNRLGASLKDQMKQAAESFTQWISVSSAIMGVVYSTKQAVSELKEVDNILTEISKTSDMTSQELEKLGMSSYSSASKYGRTATDYLTGVQEMSRSGFYGDKGTAMAEQSLLAQSAGDMTYELANSYILATNAAYKFNGEASKINEVLDGQNSITNKNSVAMADMATAMTKAGTVASSYNVSIEDLSAMIGTMESVTKLGGEEIGTGIKSLLINLQNISSSKITGTLDKANASMTEMKNGIEQLRNPIEILRDLAKTFNDLDEKDPLRAEILTNIGGRFCLAMQKCVVRMNLIAGNASIG